MPKTINASIRQAIERLAHQAKSAPEVLEGLEELVRLGLLKPPLPSVRTISGILRDARRLPSDDLPVVSWPDSFGEAGALPTEAGRSYFELMSSLSGLLPVLPLMRSFWTVTCAAPTEQVSKRKLMAQILALADTVPGMSPWPRQSVLHVELYLLAAPWLSPANRQSYEELEDSQRLDFDHIQIARRIADMRDSREKALAEDIYSGVYAGNGAARRAVATITREVAESDNQGDFSG